MKKLLKKW